MLGNISNDDYWSHLLLYIPKISYMKYFFNPLLAGIHSFLKLEESYSKSDSSGSDDLVIEVPRIVMVNLDGSETPLNFQIVQTSSSTSLFYITVFHETDPMGQSSKEETEATLAYSQLLARLIAETNQISERQRK